MSGDFSKNGPREPSADGQGGRRLPPPAFPPGSKRATPPRRPQAQPDDISSAFISPDDPIPERAGDVPGDAFISPDEPITRGSSAPDDAFISPDEPIPHRDPHTSPLATELEDEDEGVVTGIGDDAHMAPEELALGFDPHVLEVVDKVAKLAEALKQKGEAGLRSTPDMTRFETTLRSYCVGYLAGRRAEDEEG